MTRDLRWHSARLLRRLSRTSIDACLPCTNREWLEITYNDDTMRTSTALRKDDEHNFEEFSLGATQRRIAWTGARMTCTNRVFLSSGISQWCHRAPRPLHLCGSPAGLSLPSQRVRLSLSTSTQRSMQQSEWVVFFSLSLPDRNLETSMRIHSIPSSSHDSRSRDVSFSRF